MEWLSVTVALCGAAYLVWKIDKLENQVKELASISYQLDHQRDLIANLEHRLDQLDGAIDSRLHNLEHPPLTLAQREAMEASAEKIDEQIRLELSKENAKS